jgi:hypothetical protein
MSGTASLSEPGAEKPQIRPAGSGLGDLGFRTPITLITRLDQHGCGGAEPRAEDFALGLVTEQHDQRSMGRLVEVYRSVGLR